MYMLWLDGMGGVGPNCMPATVEGPFMAMGTNLGPTDQARRWQTLQILQKYSQQGFFLLKSHLRVDQLLAVLT